MASRSASRASRPGPAAGRPSARSTPGWSAEKAAKWEAKRAEKARQHGTTCWPPGHCKDEAGADGPERREPARRLTAAVPAS